MPRLLRAFSILFIGFPGAWIWLYGALSLTGTFAATIAGEASGNLMSILAALAIGFGSLILGYLMVICARIISKDPRERFAGHHFTERVAWVLSLQLTSVLAVAALFAAMSCLSHEQWSKMILPVLLAAGFGMTASRLAAHWHKLGSKWHKEITDAETARATLDSADRRT